VLSHENNDGGSARNDGGLEIAVSRRICRKNGVFACVTADFGYNTKRTTDGSEQAGNRRVAS
jgi:hypothetical protein